SLLKASGNPAIYYLHENRKRHILSPAIFESQFKWDNILYVSTAKGEQYPDGPDLKFPDSTLLKGSSGAVYVIEAGNKKHIIAPEVFNNLNYEWSNIVVISNTHLAKYPTAYKVVAERFADYSVAIYGDSRSGHSTHQALVNKIRQTDPEVTLHTGDLVSSGDSDSDWDYFNNITNELRSETSFYPTIGNHELPIADYLANFELPNNEQWYSIDDNNVHYIILDSTSDISLGSAQYIWLENDLNNIGVDINFTVVVFHHPPYNTGSHDEDEAGFQTNIVPLFESKGVDIVFNGHDHNYERSLVNGIYYIVTGGGGAPLYDQTRSSEYSQKFLVEYHFCRIQVHDDYLKVQTFDDELNKIDEFVIGGNPPVAFYSDNQSDSDADDARHQAVVDRIMNTSANPIFHAGDLQEDGTVDSLNRFNAVTNTLRSERDFYAAIGNNDSNSSLYFDNFVFPNNERWYSVNIGNLHMVALDNTYSSVAIGSAQYTWLEADLESDDSQNRITGIMFHYPIYNNTGDPKGMINTMVPLFRDRGVDFVIAGHIHSYRKEKVNNIYYFTNSGQTSLGYMIADVLEDEVWLNVYNANNTLVDTIIFDER
ncbi:MAG: metallophosphoesterase, partial [bacterium]